MRIVASRCGFLREIVLLAGAVRVENADLLVFDSCKAGGVVMLADLAGLAGDIAVFAAISFLR